MAQSASRAPRPGARRAGAPWAPASVRNQPTTAERRDRRRASRAAAARRRATRPAASGRRGGAGRPAGGGATVEHGAASSEVMARPSSRRALGRIGAPTPVSHRLAPRLVPWSGHDEPRRVRRVLQGRPRPDCCCRRTPSPATSRPPAPPSATRSSSPGTTGARSCRLDDPEALGRARTRGRTRSAGTPRGSGTARRASTPRRRRPSTPSASCRSTQRKALLLDQLTAARPRRDRPRGRASRAARPSGSCRPRTAQFAGAATSPGAR